MAQPGCNAGWRITVIAARTVSDWDFALDLAADPLQVIRQLPGRQTGPHGHHTATNVDADGGWNDRTFGRDHGSDSGAPSEMDVWHHRQMRVNEGKARDILKLFTGFGFDRNPFYPGFDRSASRRLDRFKIAHCSKAGLTSPLKIVSLAPAHSAIKNPPSEIRGGQIDWR